MTDSARKSVGGPLREALTAWGIGFAVILAFTVLYPGLAKLAATASFLYLPLWFGRRRNEDSGDYGLTFSRWREDLKLFGLVALVLTPLFFLVFWCFARVIPHVPQHTAHYLTPLVGRPRFVPRLPPRFPAWVVDHLLVVALPEEFFYRGFIQTRLRAAWPEGKILWGARLGRAGRAAILPRRRRWGWASSRHRRAVCRIDRRRPSCSLAESRKAHSSPGH